MAYAHSRNLLGIRHDLASHLQAVASLASRFASAYAAGETARYLGLWHDLGKYAPSFQATCWIASVLKEQAAKS